MIITFDVTQEDIDSGRKGVNTMCPVAKALKPYCPDKRFAVVGCWTVGICTKILKSNGIAYAKSLFEAMQPIEMMKFVAAFDDGLPVAPTTFTLEFKELT